MLRIIASSAVALLLIACNPADGGSRRQSSKAEGEPGVFDYYLLSLSWSPEYCAGPGGSRDPGQCSEGRRYGFVVHGLWPQYERGYPNGCGDGSTVPQDLVQSMLPLMPSPKLIQHEWDQHGVCSGLPVRKYFQTITKAFAAVKIPNDYKQPVSSVEVQPDDVKRKFASANSAFPAGAFRIACSGRYLSEVRVCLTKDLKSRACSSSVRDSCRDSSVIMRPVR